MNFLLVVGVVGTCMAIMAIGLIVKGKVVCKDCGLDPVTGERIGHCHCADEGEMDEKVPCGSRAEVMELPVGKEAEPADSTNADAGIPKESF